MKIEHPITRPEFDQDDLAHIKACLDSGWATQGPMVQKFEQAVSKLHNAKHALATTSCTAALHLATLSLGLSPGDEVVIPAFTWVTSAHCAEYVGAKAVFCDVNPETFNICPLSLQKAITPKTKAVVAVHLFGLSAPMDEILSITNPLGISVIEDAACAIGTTYKGQPIGGIGAIGCFSFHPRKIICTGEGGMLTTNDPVIAKKAGSYRNHGATGLPPSDPFGSKPYTMSEFNQIGYNLRLSDIQASLGVSQMNKLPMILEHRINCAEYYKSLLKDVDQIILPIDPHGGHTYQSFVIRTVDKDSKTRDRLMEFLLQNGIQTRPGTHAVHNLGYYKNKYNFSSDMFPSATLCEKTSITLPIYPRMSQENQNYIAEKIKLFFKAPSSL